MTSPTRRAVPLLAGALLLSAACGSGAPTADRDRVAASSHSGHTAPTTVVPGVAPSAESRVVPAQAASDDPVLALRSRLERLLGAHVLLADEFVRTGLLEQRRQNDAAAAAVDRNQEQIVAAVTEQAGSATGQQFAAAWSRHVDLLGVYARALQTGDAAGQQAARQQYVAAEAQLAKAFSAVVGGTVPLPALTAAATQHGNRLLDQAQAFAGEDYSRAYAIQREAFGHSIGAADVLARGVAARKRLPTAELDTPRRRLQAALSGLFGQHMGVMVQAMRAAHDGTPDFPAAGAAVNANTTEVAGALRTLYGEPASRQFLEIWAGHVEGLIAYARAEDEDARAAVREAGADYAPQLARFLASATEQRLPAIDLAAALTEHDDHLRDSLDAYAAEDYEQSQELSERGYAHMFELSQGLATAVGDAVAVKLPQGGPATGGGGLADGR